MSEQRGQEPTAPTTIQQEIAPIRDRASAANGICAYCGRPRAVAGTPLSAPCQAVRDIRALLGVIDATP